MEGLLSSTLLFFALTVLSYFIITRKKGEPNENGYYSLLPGYFLSIFIKMFVALIYFWIMLQDFEGDELKLAGTFFVGYLICTGFEIYYIFRNLRKI